MNSENDFLPLNEGQIEPESGFVVSDLLTPEFLSNHYGITEEQASAFVNMLEQFSPEELEQFQERLTESLENPSQFIQYIMDEVTDNGEQYDKDRLGAVLGGDCSDRCKYNSGDSWRSATYGYSD
jgi:hypothetical protein